MVKELVCLDGSDHAHEAFLQALRMYKPSSPTPSELHLCMCVERMHAIALPVIGAPAGAMIDNPEVYLAANHRRVESAQETMRSYGELAAKHCPGVVVRVHVLECDDAKDAVMELINKEAFDTVYVGTRNLGAVKSFFLGSFSSYLVSHSPSNVMVVRHHNKK
jgi:nucleotide-binding universal stress UspA family protein